MCILNKSSSNTYNLSPYNYNLSHSAKLSKLYAIFPSPNQVLLDWGIGLVVFGTDCFTYNFGPNNYITSLVSQHTFLIPIHIILQSLCIQSRFQYILILPPNTGTYNFTCQIIFDNLSLFDLEKLILRLLIEKKIHSNMTCIQ